MNRLRYLQLEKDNAEHFELAKPVWLNFCHEINEHDNVMETDEEIIDALQKRIGIQGSRSDMHFELALLDNEVIGFAMFAIDLGTVYGMLEQGYGTIMGVYIKPEYRRQGYGRELYRHIENVLKNDGAPKVYLTPDGVTGEPFWSAIGFKNSGKFDPDDKKYIYIKKVYEQAERYSVISVKRKDDIRFIADIYDKNIEALHGEKIKYDQWLDILTANDPDEAHFLICRGETPCAWLKINGLEDADIGWISMLVVEPVFQRMGVGTYAVGFAEDLLKEKGKQQIGVQTTSDNIPALELYKKFGFEIVSHSISVEKDNKVQLIKDISLA